MSGSSAGAHSERASDDTTYSNKVFEIIEGTKQACRSVEDLIQSVRSYAHCVPENVADLLRAHRSNIDRIHAFCTSAVAGLEAAIRSETYTGQWTGERVYDTLCQEASKERDSVADLIVSIESKMQFVKALQKANVSYTSDVERLANIKEQAPPNKEVYILFYSFLDSQVHDTDSRHMAAATRAFFLRQIKDDAEKVTDNAMFVTVDLDMLPEAHIEEGIALNTRICLFQNGAYISADMIAPEATRSQRLAYRSPFTLPPGDVAEKPDNRVPVALPCPCDHSDDSTCSEEPHDNWFCAECGDVLEYGFNGYFYCDCGAIPTASYHLHCGMDCHKVDREAMDEEVLTQLEPLKELNILLLSESHVGKSSWLNSIPNYLSHSSLDEAVKRRIKTVVPSAFWITDENYNIEKVQVGNVDLEEASLRANRDPAFRIIRTKDTLFRFLDVEIAAKAQDNVTILNQVLSLLKEGQIECIHSMCILLNSNNRNLNLMSAYFVREMRSRLHPDFAQNILFGLTHARATYYRPGDVLYGLQFMNKEFGLDLEFTPKTIYCTDSESFRFLCATQQGYEVEADGAEKSWAQSTNSIKRFLGHVATLKPHRLSTSGFFTDANLTTSTMTDDGA